MNKILNINLGGYALTIDDDAYVYLQAYLESIRQRFSESEGRDEIVSDIETRLGELITEALGNRSIVMLPDVEEATNIMGKPEEFGSEEPAAESSQTNQSKSGGKKVPPVRTGKRLFRDEEDAVVGGVCSGLSAYFGIQDPVWMRLSFVLLVFISFGFWVPAYLLMWILMRPAKSAADRLAMRGEPVNVDNIAREIEEGFERLGNKVNEFSSKSGAKTSANAQNAVKTGVTAIGQMFGFVIRFIAKFAMLIALLIAIALFLGFGGAWIASIWALITAAPFVAFFSPFSSGTTWLGFGNVFFLLAIPAIALVLFFARILFKTRVPGWVHGMMWFFWTLNFISAIVLTSFAAREYRQGSIVTKTIDLSSINSDTLFVEGSKVSGNTSYYWEFEDDVFRINNMNLEMEGLVDIDVRRGDTDQFEVVQVVKARGGSREEAMENADQTIYSVTATGNKLLVPTAFTIEKGKKWKAQTVKVIISVPQGKFIKFDESIYRRAGADRDDYSDDNDRNYISRSPNKVFQMTRDGFLCADCPKIGDKDYSYMHQSFQNFILEGDFETEIQKGDDFKVRIIGTPSDKKKLETIKTGDKITFTTNGKSADGNLRLIIESPSFNSVHCEGNGSLTIRGFVEDGALISARGATRIKAYVDILDQLDVTLSGACKLEVNGEGRNLYANLTEGASLEASNYPVDKAEISSSDGSTARVYAKEHALVLSDTPGSVKVDGGAEVKTSREQ